MNTSIKENLQAAKENVVSRAQAAKENVATAAHTARENMATAAQAAKENMANAAQAAKENLAAARQDVLNARKCENINDPIDTHVVDYVAMSFSKLFIKLHIIPNVVTIFALIAGVSGGVVLALNRGLGMDILGAVLVFLSAVFDASDGQVARLTKHYSRLGRMLDGLSDASGYFSIYLACVLRIWDWQLISNSALWHVLIIVLGLVTFLAYVAQCQLPDYFKNLHMYMIDNSHGNELTRAKHIKAELEQPGQSAFNRFSLFCYYNYTATQERRAPKTQKLLDAIEGKGKSDALCDAFYAVSRRMVKLTNLLTFNLRTIVLLICVFLHWELGALLFVVLVLEPIRLILLHRYEALSERLYSLTQ